MCKIKIWLIFSSIGRIFKPLNKKPKCWYLFLMRKNKFYIVITGIKIFFVLCCFLFFKENWSLKRKIIYSLSFHCRFRFLFFSILLFCLKTFFQNPGVFPRSKNLFLETKQKSILDYRLLKNYTINGFTLQTKLCLTCCVWKSPRTKHCPACNICSCISDHHCPRLGACISYRNYNLYITFLLSLWWYSIFISKQIILVFSPDIKKIIFTKCCVINPLLILKTIMIWIVLVLNLIFLFASQVFVGGLLFGHLYLFFISKTTSEFLKMDTNYYTLDLKKSIFEKTYPILYQGSSKKGFKKKKKIIFNKLK
ncbi:hypothetical protein CMESO_490 (nucleomorph) [Chroomonas mesostigmatica CCMP1168]|uniref:Palmitoyltransferase n=1 Tax=Chroomonas mesostigmatica CCMP1168 TaxID=1195612 RepID=J7G3K2_9CRYP|nr:hypothetical protein CMESO_490 [Chroomonas mesostigmatica CCMP1168]